MKVLMNACKFLLLPSTWLRNRAEQFNTCLCALQWAETICITDMITSLWSMCRIVDIIGLTGNHMLPGPVSYEMSRSRIMSLTQDTVLPAWLTWCCDASQFLLWELSDISYLEGARNFIIISSQMENFINNQSIRSIRIRKHWIMFSGRKP